jgi:mono/diheme cytochrome c family protein
VDGKAAYKIPADNPLVGVTRYFGRDVDPTKVRTEYYANGLRNAWRFSIDEPTGRMFAADVGQNLWEEVDLIVKGGNYGWSYREAFHSGPRMASTPPEAKLIDPIYEYGHGNMSGQFSGNSISGGFVYRGTNLSELTGKYIFADYVSRRVWALASNVNSPVECTADPRNGDPLIVSIGPLNNQSNGKVYRLVRTGVQGIAPPALLSQVGAFKDLKTLEPANGLVPYEPNVSFWSDYAVKQRWFIVAKSSDTIGFNPTGNWTFPTGMVWVKNFEMEMTRGDATTRRRLETRFIVKTATGVYGITYKWRPDGSDADLVPEGGMDEVLDIKQDGIVKKQTWHYPSVSECLRCHTDVAGGVLGFNTWQLNGNGQSKENQIEMLAKAGYFTPGSDMPEVKKLGAYAKADDTKASLEWRVRSYLGANCLQCHQPGGVVQGFWDARPTTATDMAGLINGPLVSDRGDRLVKVVVPGDTAHSMLLTRMQGHDAPRMPPLATSEEDPASEKLVGEWINSLQK